MTVNPEEKRRQAHNQSVREAAVVSAAPRSQFLLKHAGVFAPFITEKVQSAIRSAPGPSLHYLVVVLKVDVWDLDKCWLCRIGFCRVHAHWIQARAYQNGLGLLPPRLITAQQTKAH